MTMWNKINIAKIPGFKIGHEQDHEALTGVTVILFEEGVKAGVDISGGGPASRETPLALPMTADNPINAIVLSGGSAFGLAAADGVMNYLEEHGIGYETGYAKVPLVLQSCIYDLGIGRSDVRPDRDMGYRACVNAEMWHENEHVVTGNIGGGTGATVGKLHGMKDCSKSGLGMFAAEIGSLYVAAVTVVNAVGNIRDPKTNEVIGGVLNEENNGFISAADELYKVAAPRDMFAGNTTISCVITNGKFNKAEMNKIASMCRNAYARCIDPVGTMADGDSIYAVCTGEVTADLNMTGTFATEVLERAIVNAVESSVQKFVRQEEE